MGGKQSNVKGGHFFERDLSKFDAPFFHMTPGEAAVSDGYDVNMVLGSG
jgi:hypothetical protein